MSSPSPATLAKLAAVVVRLEKLAGEGPSKQSSLEATVQQVERLGGTIQLFAVVARLQRLGCDVGASPTNLEEASAGVPDDVDKAKKELYLSDEEFETVFKCTKAEFAKKPLWKQQSLKKAAGLY